MGPYICPGRPLRCDWIRGAASGWQCRAPSGRRSPARARRAPPTASAGPPSPRAAAAVRSARAFRLESWQRPRTPQRKICLKSWQKPRTPQRKIFRAVFLTTLLPRLGLHAELRCRSGVRRRGGAWEQGRSGGGEAGEAREVAGERCAARAFCVFPSSSLALALPQSAVKIRQAFCPQIHK